MLGRGAGRKIAEVTPTAVAIPVEVTRTKLPF